MVFDFQTIKHSQTKLSNGFIENQKRHDKYIQAKNSILLYLSYPLFFASYLGMRGLTAEKLIIGGEDKIVQLGKKGSEMIGKNNKFP